MSDYCDASHAGEEDLPDTHYSYEEFEKDFYGFIDAMEAENTAFAKANGEEVELGFMRTSMFLRDYMETREPNVVHRTRKALTIFIVSDYIITNAEALDVGQHLVRGRETMLFSDCLVKAIFRLMFQQEIYRGLANMPVPAEVLALADRFKRCENETRDDTEGHV